MVAELTLQPGFSIRAASAFSGLPVVLCKMRGGSQPRREDGAVYRTGEVPWTMSLKQRRQPGGASVVDFKA